MKLGTENKVEFVLAVVLAIGAILSITYWVTSSSSSSPASATALVPNSAQKPVASAVIGKTLDPQLRLDLLKLSEGVRYEGKGRNIFVAGAPPEIPKVKEPPLKANGSTAPPVAQPQGPPPIDLKFFGFASRPGEPTKIFLSHGENVFVAREGDIVDRQYKVVKIGTASVEIEDVLHNNRQSIPLIRG